MLFGAIRTMLRKPVEFIFQTTDIFTGRTATTVLETFVDHPVAFLASGVVAKGRNDGFSALDLVFDLVHGECLFLVEGEPASD